MYTKCSNLSSSFGIRKHFLVFDAWEFGTIVSKPLSMRRSITRFAAGTPPSHSISRNPVGLVNWVREEVFPFHAEIAANGATDFMEDARLVIDEPTVLTQVVSQLNDLRLDRVDADTKGDLFEHVLRQIGKAGELGQFRTPRHIIRALVRLVDPHLGETICDPAAGTAGFLVGAWDHVRLANTSPMGMEEVEVDGKVVQRGLGDKLSQEAVQTLKEKTFHGADVDPQMVRLATMNLNLRGLDRLRVLRRDALTRSLDRSTKAELGLPPAGFDVILANPPSPAGWTKTASWRGSKWGARPRRNCCSCNTCSTN